jgi:hypothetical protein
MATPSGIFSWPYERFGPWLPDSARRRISRARPTTPRTIVNAGDPPIPYELIDTKVATLAMAEVKARLEGQLAVKAATEARATTLVNNCIAVLTVISGATLFDFRAHGFSPLIVAFIIGSICLLIAAFLAYLVINPSTLALPGRLPSQIWPELVKPKMDEKVFTVRLIASSQEGMYDNEIAQNQRGRRLKLAIFFAIIAIPVAGIGFLTAVSIPDSPNAVSWITPS